MVRTNKMRNVLLGNQLITRAPLDLLRSLVEFRSDGPKVSVEKIIAALEKANLVEAPHIEKVFSTGVDKVVAVILETPFWAEGATVTVVEDFVRHSPHLAELEAKLRDTTSVALWDHLAHVDAETRKTYAPQQGSEDGTLTATSESLCWARALKKSRWATSGGAGSPQDEEGKLKWVQSRRGHFAGWQGSLPSLELWVQKLWSKHCRHQWEGQDHGRSRRE